MTGLKRQAPGALLLGDAEFRWHSTDRGIDWVYDQYGIARADLFRDGSKLGEGVGGIVMRRMLDRVRAEAVLPGDVNVTGGPLELRGGVQTMLVGTLYAHVAVNPKMWAGWVRSGCTPRLTDGGKVLWFATVRGKPALFGVLMTVRLGVITKAAT